jgi:hypothetical protein
MSNFSTYSKRSGNFRQLAESLRKATLKNMAHFAVEASPVDTSAYVDSFGFNEPQGYTSRGRPRKQDVAGSKARNKSRLSSDIGELDLEGPVVFSNNAPHANIVETGTSKQPGTHVFAQTRREFTNLARQALQEVKGK